MESVTNLTLYINSTVTFLQQSLYDAFFYDEDLQGYFS